MPGPDERGRRGSRLPSGFATLRDVVTFVAGLGIITHQVFIRETADPTVMLVGVSLMGLPLVFADRTGGNR